jgi:hypothetical protein
MRNLRSFTLAVAAVTAVALATPLQAQPYGGDYGGYGPGWGGGG